MAVVNWNPATRIETVKPSTMPQRPAPQDLEERMMIARLFGKTLPAAQPTSTTQPSPTNDHDDLAPNLGRNLDVLA
jgi:hypothetical protein